MNTKKEIFIIAIIITAVTVGSTFFLFNSQALAPQIMIKDKNDISSTTQVKKEIKGLYKITKD